MGPLEALAASLPIALAIITSGLAVAYLVQLAVYGCVYLCCREELRPVPSDML